MSDKQQRTEKPTQFKRQEERGRGNLFRHRESVVALVFLAELGFIKYNLGTAYEKFKAYYAHLFQQPLPTDFSDTYVQGLVNSTLVLIGELIGPLMVLVLLLGLAGQLAQGGWNFAAAALTPKPERILPTNNFKRLFSGLGSFELLKNCLFFVLIGFLGWRSIAALWPRLPQWTYLHPGDTGVLVLGAAYDVTLQIAFCYLLLSVVHYYVQKQQFEKQMKMTKHEVKEEFKQLQGNPQVKAKIRSVQFQRARQRMMKAVPQASVVVTNPTHYAVALRYNPDTMVAPQVVAKGRNWLALRIREVAEEHGVPIVENKPLAQLLYRKVEIDDTIPAELYRAVAEILAYLIRAREALRA